MYDIGKEGICHPKLAGLGLHLCGVRGSSAALQRIFIGIQAIGIGNGNGNGNNDIGVGSCFGGQRNCVRFGGHSNCVSSVSRPKFLSRGFCSDTTCHYVPSKRGRVEKATGERGCGAG